MCCWETAAAAPVLSAALNDMSSRLTEKSGTRHRLQKEMLEEIACYLLNLMCGAFSLSIAELNKTI